MSYQLFAVVLSVITVFTIAVVTGRAQIEPVHDDAQDLFPANTLDEFRHHCPGCSARFHHQNHPVHLSGNGAGFRRELGRGRIDNNVAVFVALFDLGDEASSSLWKTSNSAGLGGGSPAGQNGKLFHIGLEKHIC